MASRSLLYKIAFRYFSSKKSHSVINLISWVSIVAIAVPVAAMIILLSVHNGFEVLIGKLWGGYGAELVIEPTNMSEMRESDYPIDAILSVEGVEGVSGYLDRELLLNYKDRQVSVMCRGIDSVYVSSTNLLKTISHGGADITDGAIVGLGVAYQLGLKVNLSENFTVIAPRNAGFRLFSEDAYFSKLEVPLEGVFMIDAQRDNGFMFLDIDDLSLLNGSEGIVSAVAIVLEDGYRWSDVYSTLQEVVGDDFKVKNLLQQNELEYRMVQSEKLAIYMILLLVVIIASLTMVGSMLMLIIEKRDSSRYLTILGFTKRDIRDIFVFLGSILSTLGVIIGLIIGVGVVMAQQIFEFVPLFGAGLLVDSYPVKLMGIDIVIVVLSVVVVTSILSRVVSRTAIKMNESS